MSEKSAQVIRNFLHTHNLSQLKFAELAGISRYSVQKYLQGARIHPKTAKKIEDNIKDNYREFLPYEKLID